MSVSTRPVRTTRRPAAVRALVATLGFLGLTALGGGVEMLLFPDGNEFLPPEFLDQIPIVDSFLVPGIVLAGVFGLGSLVAMVGVLRRPHWPWLDGLERWTDHHWSWAASLGLGIAFLTWMAVEITWLGTPWESPAGSEERLFAFALYGIYLTVAALLLSLPWARSVRDHLSSRVPVGR